MKRSAPLRRHTPLAPVNRKRRQSEFARTYHSRERVRFVKSLPCIVCASVHHLFAIATAGHSHNAHTVSGGKGRKADYTTIVPMCASHHRRYDEHRAPCDSEIVRDAIKRSAADVEAAWQRHLTTKRPATAKTTKRSDRGNAGSSPARADSTPTGEARSSNGRTPHVAPRCGLCGRRCVARADGQAFADHGLCASCLTGTGRKTA